MCHGSQKKERRMKYRQQICNRCTAERSHNDFIVDSDLSKTEAWFDRFKCFIFRVHLAKPINQITSVADDDDGISKNNFNKIDFSSQVFFSIKIRKKICEKRSARNQSRSSHFAPISFFLFCPSTFCTPFQHITQFCNITFRYVF